MIVVQLRFIEPVCSYSCKVDFFFRFSSAYAGSFESCKELLDAGADPNIVDQSFRDGRTALHKAAAGGHRNVYELLLAYGADDSIVDASGRYARELFPAPSASVELKPAEEDPVAKERGETSIAVENQGNIAVGFQCPTCGNSSLLFTRYGRGLVCLNCYSKR